MSDIEYQIEVTYDATRDLADIYTYISLNDSVENAKYVLNEIKKVILTLKKYPNRGNYVKELLSVGIKDFREIYFKAYRVIYNIMEEKIYVMLVMDGRRSLKRILERRLLQ